MAVDTIQDTVGTGWKAMTSLDGEYHVTAEGEVRYAIGTTPPAAGFMGHLLTRGQSTNLVLDTGRILYMYGPNGAVDVFLTKSW